jgi:exopolysaccharide biosynthesis polyprenyl glycosylphosphotransferase
MLQQQVMVINTILMAVDALCVIGAGYGAYCFRVYSSGGSWSMETIDFVISVMFIMFVNNYMMGRANLYGERRIGSLGSMAWAILKAVVIDFAALAAGVFLLKNPAYSRGFMAAFCLLTFVFLLVHRLVFCLHFNKSGSKGFSRRHIVVVANRERGKLVNDFLDCQLSWGHKVIGRVSPTPKDDDGGDVVGYIDDLPQLFRTQAIDEVVFALSGDRRLDLQDYLDLCRRVGVEVRILPALWQPGDQQISAERCQSIPFLTIQTTNINATGVLYKRMLDFAGGLVGTMIFFLIYPFVAVAIKMDCSGPVLFKQKRIGQNGREFYLYKFRSMCPDAEQKRQQLMSRNQMNGHMFKIKDDPRITKVGRWLRNTSIDEMPQFLNVLKGEMSLVGTRPPMPEEVCNYQLEHLKRIAAKPGITGLWQISGRNKIVDFEKIVALDCQYLESWRFYDDLKIIAKTIWIVLQRKGAV